MIITNGQTGVAIAALTLAKKTGRDTGGCAPFGYMTEKGPQVEALKGFGLYYAPALDLLYSNIENINRSQATLILTLNNESVDQQTLEYLRQSQKPFAIANPSSQVITDDIRELFDVNINNVLHIVGDQEGEAPGVAKQVMTYLKQLIVFDERKYA